MREKLTLEEGYKRINKIINQPLKNLLNDNQFDKIIVNKGKTGTLLEELINLEPVSRHNDFTNGDLKSNYVKENSISKEPLAITQALEWFKKVYIEEIPFHQTNVYKKIKKFLYVPICKIPVNVPKEWRFLKPIVFDESKEECKIFYKLWKEDYDVIQKKVRYDLENKNKFHTFNGPWNYLQIRSKGAGGNKSVPIIINNFQYRHDYMAFYFKANFFKKLNESKIGVS